MLCVIDIYNSFAWVFPLKDKKGITITNFFHQISEEFNCKPNKIWVDKGSKFCKRSIMSWLQDKEKFIVAERFVRTLKEKKL